MDEGRKILSGLLVVESLLREGIEVLATPFLWAWNDMGWDEMGWDVIGQE